MSALPRRREADMGLMDGLGSKAKELVDRHTDTVVQFSDQGLQSTADSAHSRSGG